MVHGDLPDYPAPDRPRFVPRPVRFVLAAAAALASLAVALVALDLVLRQVARLAAEHAPPRGGVITVESPEVYGRERLLNDRREQAEWLTARLNERLVDGEDAPDGSERRRSGTIVQAGGSGARPEQGGDGAALALRLGPREALRAELELREELRGERLQALFDDRHDIAGNTLALLSFDTTVARERGENRLGLVLMRLAHAPDAADFRRTYRDWVRQWDERLQVEIEDTAAQLRAGTLPDPDHAELIALLSREVCETLFRDGGGDPSARCSGLLRPDGPEAFVATLKRFKEMIAARLEEQVKKALEERRRETEDVLATIKPEAILGDENWWPRRNDKASIKPPRWPALRARGPDGVRDWYEAVMEACRLRSGFDYALVTTTELQVIERVNEAARSRNAAVSGAADFLRAPEFPCPPSAQQREAAALLRLRAWLEDHRALRREIAALFEPGGKEATANELVAHRQGWTEAAQSAEAQRRPREATPPSSSAPEPRDRDGAAQSHVSRCVSVALNQARARARGESGSDAEVPATCKTANLIVDTRRGHVAHDVCAAVALHHRRVRDRIAEMAESHGLAPALAKIETDRPLSGSGPCSLRLVPREAVAEPLIEALERGVETFAYAVTPRGDRERFAWLERRLETIRAGLGRGAGGEPPQPSLGTVASVLGALGLGHDREQESRLVAHRTIVVGFGTPPPSGRGREGGKAGAAPSAVFGWLLAPRRTSDPDLASLEQLRLQALVSVPSWWQSARIEVITCWVTPARIADAKARGEEDLWDGARGELGRNGCREQAMAVRLPGSIDAISTKLGLSGTLGPRVTPPRPGQQFAMPQPRLRLGEEAALVIIGERLWRNTEVTLGPIRASRIRVMPDMRGIVAEFGRLEAMPAENRGLSEVERLGFGLPRDFVERGCARMVPVRVWTSEGMAEVEGGVLVLRPERRDGNGVVRDCVEAQAPGMQKGKSRLPTDSPTTRAAGNAP